MSNAKFPQEAEDLLNRRFEKIIVLSGAGISADSGIPTFRSGQNGLWTEFNPGDLATRHAWKKNKALVWGWYEWRRGLVNNAEPNAGHVAAARLQRDFGASVITQNVDDLHERAGANDVIHLHGSLLVPRCASCGKLGTFTQAPALEPLREIPPPRCTCGESIRPGVVWFGEDLPIAELLRAKRLMQECDLLLVVGTSGNVYPAAGLIELVRPDAVVIEINPEATPQSMRMSVNLRTTAAIGLPWVIDRLLQ